MLLPCNRQSGRSQARELMCTGSRHNQEAYEVSEWRGRGEADFSGQCICMPILWRAQIGGGGALQFLWEGTPRLGDCYWIGSLDSDFLVEPKLRFPLNPQQVVDFLQGGRCNQATVTWVWLPFCWDALFDPIDPSYGGASGPEGPGGAGDPGSRLMAPGLMAPK